MSSESTRGHRCMHVNVYMYWVGVGQQVHQCVRPSPDLFWYLIWRANSIWCTSLRACRVCRFFAKGYPLRNTLQHTATHCNTLQLTATHCNTLQHTATHCPQRVRTSPELSWCVIFASGVKTRIVSSSIHTYMYADICIEYAGVGYGA